MRKLAGLLAFLAAIWALPPSADAQPQNSITFDNQSGAVALVKVVGPTPHTVEVPSGQKRTVRVALGSYYLLVRYGNEGHYTYSRGDAFSVEETADSRSAISITLHKVVAGNYGSRESSSQEFDGANAAPPTAIRSDDIPAAEIAKVSQELAARLAGEPEIIVVRQPDEAFAVFRTDGVTEQRGNRITLKAGINFARGLRNDEASRGLSNEEVADSVLRAYNNIGRMTGPAFLDFLSKGKVVGIFLVLGKPLEIDVAEVLPRSKK